MRPTIKLVPYEEFGRLRLRPFCPDDEHYKESTIEEKQGHYFQEYVWGVSFMRWFERPDELAAIGIHSYGDGATASIWPQTTAPILSAIKLRLEPGLSYEEVASRFVVPPRWRSKDGKTAIWQTGFHTGGNSPYEVNCRFLHDDKLDAILVHRLDVKMPLNN